MKTKTLTHLQKNQEARRLQAEILFKKGFRDADIARQCKVSRTAVHYWRKSWRKKGREGLRGAPTGRPAKISRTALRKLEKKLLLGPRANGFPTDLWTGARVERIVRRVAGISYGKDSIWYVLHELLGWSPQKPIRRAKARDEKAIKYWQETTWATAKKRGSVAA